MSESIVVTVKEGKVRGFKTKSAYSKIEYYSFLGIPYGQSTAGYARFKDPVKAKPWNDTLDGTVEKEGCAQFSLLKRGMVGSEDCLYNNIHTLKIPRKGETFKAKPVIVFIHPGSMTHGSPEPHHYGAPDFFMHHDVVYVGIAYRLHFLGLLNLETKNCTGNQCFKDITLSLQWIKENISVFGGDPENVTLMGSSSGSAIVHILLLSPFAKGLYHKAVLMGCYIFNPLLIFHDDPIAIAHEFGSRLGYNEKNVDNERLLKFYKKLRMEHFFQIRAERFFGRDSLNVYPFAPFMPAIGPNENSHLPQSPRKLIPSTNRVPIMVGFCEREAVMALAYKKFFKQSLTEVFPRAIRQNCWGWGADLNEEELKQIRKEVEDFYLNGKSIETASPPELCDIISDAGLSDVYDSLINVISADLSSSVYVYNFCHDGELDLMKEKLRKMSGVDLKGAYHAADFCYWCFVEESGGKTGEKLLAKDREIIEMYTRLITTFAETNDPNYNGLNVNWKPTSPEHPSYLVIKEKLEVKDEILNGERMEFWHKLKNKYQKSSNT